MINGLVSEAGTGSFRNKYFTEGSEDYALTHALDNDCFLTDRVMFNYVPHSFLDGIVNQLEILKVFVGNRYCNVVCPNENDNDLEANLYFEGKWQKITKKSRKAMMDVVVQSTPCHTEFGIFGDDVFILAETDNWFWLLEYDPDTSDCCVGRFRKTEMLSVDVNDGSGTLITPTGVVHNRDDVVRNFVAAIMEDADEKEPPLEWLTEHRSSWYAF